MRFSEHKAAVGGFFLVGVGILIFGIMALGGGQLFSKDVKFNIWFDTSVSGLSLGAPVVFRGVDLGTVTSIGLAVTSDMSNALIPVVVQIDSENLVRAAGGGTATEDEAAQIIRNMVAQGMRAKLQMSSIITGQYRIALGFHPGIEPVYRSGDPQWEIPSVTGSLDNMTKALDQMPIQEMLANLENTLDRLGAIIMSGEIERCLTSFANTMENADTLLASMQSLPGSLNTLLVDIDKAVVSANKAIVDADKTINDFGDDIAPAMVSFQHAMDDLAGTARELSRFVARTSKELSPTAHMYVEMEKILKEFTALSRSVRSLTNTLDRNPEVLIQGRRGAY